MAIAKKAPTKSKVAADSIQKISLVDIKSGSLVGQIRNETIEFWHEGEQYSVDVRIQSLPFVETESLHKRLNAGEDVVSEWISKALVDDEGKQQFTAAQIDQTFVQGLAVAVFDKVWGADNLKKMAEKLTNQEAS